MASSSPSRADDDPLALDLLPLPPSSPTQPSTAQHCSPTPIFGIIMPRASSMRQQRKRAAPAVAAVEDDGCCGEFECRRAGDREGCKRLKDSNQPRPQRRRQALPRRSARLSSSATSEQSGSMLVLDVQEEAVTTCKGKAEPVAAKPAARKESRNVEQSAFRDKAKAEDACCAVKTELSFEEADDSGNDGAQMTQLRFDSGSRTDDECSLLSSETSYFSCADGGHEKLSGHSKNLGGTEYGLALQKINCIQRYGTEGGALGLPTRAPASTAPFCFGTSYGAEEMLGGDGVSFAATYGVEYNRWLLEREGQHLPGLYLHKQDEVTASFRTQVVDWMADIIEETKLSRFTLFIAVNLLDRTLECESIFLRELQLLASACLLLASKFEEVCALPAAALLRLLRSRDSRITIDDLTDMERCVLLSVGFKVLCITPAHFEARYFEAAGSNPRQRLLVNYLLELALHDYALVGVKSSIKAASALLLARLTMCPRGSDRVHWERVWPESVRVAIGYLPSDLKACVMRLHFLQSHAEGSEHTRAIRERYSNCKRLGVANIVCLLQEDLCFQHSD